MSPGLNEAGRQLVFQQSKLVEQALKHARLWSALATLLTSEAETDGRVRVGSPHPESGLREISVTSVKPLHYKIRRLLLLHLDATLSPNLAEAVLRPCGPTKSRLPSRKCRSPSSPVGSARAFSVPIRMSPKPSSNAVATDSTNA